MMLGVGSVQSFGVPAPASSLGGRSRRFVWPARSPEREPFGLSDGSGRSRLGFVREVVLPARSGETTPISGESRAGAADRLGTLEGQLLDPLEFGFAANSRAGRHRPLASAANLERPRTRAPPGADVHALVFDALCTRRFSGSARRRREAPDAPKSAPLGGEAEDAADAARATQPRQNARQEVAGEKCRPETARVLCRLGGSSAYPELGACRGPGLLRDLLRSTRGFGYSGPELRTQSGDPLGHLADLGFGRTSGARSTA